MVKCIKNRVQSYERRERYFMGKADDVTKKYLQDNTRFADIVNYYLYDGKQVIKPEDLVERDPTELGIIPTIKDSFISKQKVRDILKRMVIKQGKDVIFVLVGIENQTDIHYAIPVKNALYDVLEYSRQVENYAKKHKKNKDIKGAEFLSGMKAGEKLVPVITITLYYGDRRWDGPKSLYEMFAVKDENLLKYIPDYKINLIDPHTMTDEDMLKFATDINALLKIVRVSGDKEQLGDLIKNDPQLSHFSVETGRVIQVVTKIPVKFTNGKEGASMCTAVEQILSEGIIKGKLEGKKELIHRLVIDGDLSIEKGAARLNQTPEELKRDISLLYNIQIS